VLAEKQGFEFICTSDHFHPWFHKGGCAGQAWVWIGTAGAKTNKVRLGTGVTPCLFRYHPALVAQAFATLDEMFPGRIFLGIGTGEAMNEIPLGFKWPRFKERLKRTEEAVIIIKSLWKEDFTDFEGNFFKLRGANLYTKPKEKIPIYFAASGPRAARASGRLGDALMTGVRERERAQILLAAYKEGVKESGRRIEGMPKMVELKISYDKDYDKALDSLSIWRVVLFPNIINKPISDPRELDKMGKQVDLKQLSKLVFTDIEEIISKIEENIEIGFNEIQVGSSSPNEEKFILEFGRKVLPYLQDKYSTL
jgi:coenzyme F420-dependent glucose-6-phosphate dehydrogenase